MQLIRLRSWLVATLLVAMWWSQNACAQTIETWRPESELRAFAAKSLALPDAELSVTAGSGLTRTVTRNGAAIAYIGSSWEIAHTAGYSGSPVNVLVLVDLHAVIRGAWLLLQQDPILTTGVEPGELDSFMASFIGYDLNEPLQTAQDKIRPIVGATISSGVIRSGIIRTARSIASDNGLLANADDQVATAGAVTPKSWDELLKSGGIAHLLVTGADADKALGTASGSEAQAAFIDLYLAELDPPTIGVSLLGNAGYSKLQADIEATDHAILMAANGLYSFKGTAWRRTGSFERIEIEQGGHTIALNKEMHRPLEKLEANGAPELREMAIFALPQNSGFKPAEPFRLSLIATRGDEQGNEKNARFVLAYQLPAEFLAKVGPVIDPNGAPLWRQNWIERLPAIATVIAMLLALYIILIFQNQIAARPKLYRGIRIGYLLATVIVLGGVIGAQLSVVHVVTFLHAMRTDFSWETFLLDPVTFIIWCWVAVAMLFWGRVYCGWLCPFGALQELINKAGQLLGIKQVNVPFALHERLWPIKYIAFLGIFAASLSSMALAFEGAEIEPFKTVVALHFLRAWPFVLYALALLLAGLFVERFFCRYLCPMGAAIAIPARLRMFEWLKRRPQCGRECRICSTKCPVQAIHPEGNINPNECIYCLNCQTLYYDEHICPPLKQRAARRYAVKSEAAQP